LPSLPPLHEVQERLQLIFPQAFPNRAILVGPMAARVVFVILYGGFVQGSGRYLRPSFVYFFTREQAARTSVEERLAWLSSAHKQGHRPDGHRWYADTSREPIRDDLMRNQLLRMGLAHKLPGHATTASRPTWFLDAAFAALFDPALHGAALDAAIARWQAECLDPAALQRMALRAQGAERREGDVLIDLPDDSRLRMAAGPSALIARGLVEDFARYHLKKPLLLWLSASDKKAYAQFVELAASVGLAFDLSAALPDLILADAADPVMFVMCEIVATDGAVTDARKRALLDLVRASRIPEANVRFVSAFEDRESAALRKNFSQLAIDTWVWFRTEPRLLVELRGVAPRDRRSAFKPPP
jgi:hypothetical protein